MDIWAYNWTIDLLPGQKYVSLKEQHELKYCRSHTMQNVQSVITGCQMIDFDCVLQSNSKSKHVIWIYRWTRCTTHWEPGQFRRVRRCRWNRTRIDSSGLFKTRTANLPPVRFRSVTGPEVTVQTRCQHWQYGIPFLHIMSSWSKMTCLHTCMVWFELCPRKRHKESKT